MTKLQTFKIVLLAVIIAIVLEIFVSPWIAARLALVPWIARYGILRPQAPIVINTQREVRVSDTGDAQEAIARAKPAVSAVLVQNQNGVQVTGSALNLTTDGLFVTVKSALPAGASKYYLKLSGGKTQEIEQAVFDPATNLVFLKASVRDIPLAGFATSEQVQVGQKVVGVSGSGVDFLARGVVTSALSVQDDALGVVQFSDMPTRSFTIQPIELTAGSVMINTDGEVLGLWDGKQVVSSDVIRTAQSLYVNGQNAVVRPSFGFYYKNLSSAETQILNLPAGAQVTAGDAGAVVSHGPAESAGLKAGDIITRWNDAQINGDQPLEELLEHTKPGDVVKVTVRRGNTDTVLSLTIGQVK